MKIKWVGAVLVLFTMTGCVEQQLKISTDTMIPTLRHIQEEQILDNLGQFLADPNAVPVEVCITGGGVQAANQLQPSFAFPFHGWMGNQASLQIQGQWTENWSITPVCDADDLRRLQALYRYAVGAINYDQFTNQYPTVSQKDTNGNPTLVPVKINPYYGFSADNIGAISNFANAERNCSTTNSDFKGFHQGRGVWIKDRGALDEFIMLISAATPNTVGSGAGGGAGGGKGKASQLLLPAIQ